MKNSNIVNNYGTNVTEAILDVEYYDPKTHVNIPREAAVEEAKAWVEDNEK